MSVHAPPLAAASLPPSPEASPAKPCPELRRTRLQSQQPERTSWIQQRLSQIRGIFGPSGDAAPAQAPAESRTAAPSDAYEPPPGEAEAQAAGIACLGVFVQDLISVGRRTTSASITLLLVGILDTRQALSFSRCLANISASVISSSLETYFMFFDDQNHLPERTNRVQWTCKFYFTAHGTSR
ncbi:hypothetical protein AB1Y20_020118 [Prymnesium parvum]|uniref:Uncharacterized protein n=1 Tax=Prymnesium parvum TaxID=97485 RepID=A0AB34JW71_PRYPA